MNEPDKKKRIPRKESVPVSKGNQGRGKTADEKPSDSDDVERAVYDGMQDLRVKRSG